MDVTQYIKAKSDQLNADDLMGGPITVQIMGVKEGSKEQPVIIEISGGHQPFKPSKTDRRVLVAAWGAEALAWVGRSMTLWRDPLVIYAGVQVGGIRITHLSHIESDLTLMLSEVRGKKKERKIKRLALSESSKPANKATQATPVTPTQEQFEYKFSQVKELILSGAGNADDCIATLSKKFILTDAQKQAIRDIEKPAETETGTQTDPEDGMFD
jgi:hypothetical protein